MEFVKFGVPQLGTSYVVLATVQPCSNNPKLEGCAPHGEANHPLSIYREPAFSKRKEKSVASELVDTTIVGIVVCLIVDRTIHERVAITSLIYS